MASITHASTRPGPDRKHPVDRVGRGWLRALLLTCLALWSLVTVTARAGEPEVLQASLQRSQEGLFLSARLNLQPTAAVEDALLRGVPLYFVWEADVLRERWYWTDKRLASAVRTWRLVYQPLTRRWRLSLANDNGSGGGASGLQYALHQNYDSLAEALASIGRVARWKIADAGRLDTDSAERVEWRFRLDLGLLPRPFQIGMANQSEWVIEVLRRLDVPSVIEPADSGES